MDIDEDPYEFSQLLSLQDWPLADINDPDYEYHMTLLEDTNSGNDDQTWSRVSEEVKTSPLFLGGVLNSTIVQQINVTPQPSLLPQYGLLAKYLDMYQENSAQQVEGNRAPISRNDPRIFLNVNTPWSAFICGSQGTGKSHTLSCMLENCLSAPKLGKLPKPLAAMVFHYDKFTSLNAGQICEAAYLSSKDIPVTVLVSPTNFKAMNEAYSKLPNISANVNIPRVISFQLEEKHLNIERMMNLMAVREKDGPAPLYIEVMVNILREMAMESQGARGLNYQDFSRRLTKEGFSNKQNAPLRMRLRLLEATMGKQSTPGAYKGHKKDLNIWSFEPGSLTIVDLSCPFIDESAACALFDIALALFLENRGNVGRVIALDEAHKFMTSSDSASRFTENLLQVIRMQRHLGTRIIIATQEPTISPKLLDLASMTIVHRFTSPEWLTALKSHLAGVAGLDGESKRDMQQILRTIVTLGPGEALLFSPSAILSVQDHKPWIKGFKPVVEKLGMRYIKMQVRKRLTADGGQSIVAI